MMLLVTLPDINYMVHLLRLRPITRDFILYEDEMHTRWCQNMLWEPWLRLQNRNFPPSNRRLDRVIRVAIDRTQRIKGTRWTVAWRHVSRGEADTCRGRTSILNDEICVMARKPKKTHTQKKGLIHMSLHLWKPQRIDLNRHILGLSAVTLSSAVRPKRCSHKEDRIRIEI